MNIDFATVLFYKILSNQNLSKKEKIMEKLRMQDNDWKEMINCRDGLTRKYFSSKLAGVAFLLASVSFFIKADVKNINKILNVHKT